jgi:hypothetical protein
LAQELKVARADGSYVKLLQRLQRIRLLIIPKNAITIGIPVA